MNETCPFCGSELWQGSGGANLPIYACGTKPPNIRMFDECYERQLAALQSRLEAAEALLTTWRGVGIICNQDIQKYAPSLYAELKTAGEI